MIFQRVMGYSCHTVFFTGTHTQACIFFPFPTRTHFLSLSPTHTHTHTHTHTDLCAGTPEGTAVLNQSAFVDLYLCQLSLWRRLISQMVKIPEMHGVKNIYLHFQRLANVACCAEHEFIHCELNWGVNLSSEATAQTCRKWPSLVSNKIKLSQYDNMGSKNMGLRQLWEIWVLIWRYLGPDFTIQCRQQLQVHTLSYRPSNKHLLNLRMPARFVRRLGTFLQKTRQNSTVTERRGSFFWILPGKASSATCRGRDVCRKHV